VIGLAERLVVAGSGNPAAADPVVRGSLGIEITPILPALGVGGLAVALALQDTLSNLFAGIHLLADKPIRVGDYVKLADTVEGHVEDIGWRSTRVRMLQNVVVTIPNKRVAESIITNYDMPEPRLALLIRVGVDYGADPDLVERLLVEEASGAVGEVPACSRSPRRRRDSSRASATSPSTSRSPARSARSRTGSSSSTSSESASSVASRPRESRSPSEPLSCAALGAIGAPEGPCRPGRGGSPSDWTTRLVYSIWTLWT